MSNQQLRLRSGSRKAQERLFRQLLLPQAADEGDEGEEPAPAKKAKKKT